MVCFKTTDLNWIFVEFSRLELIICFSLIFDSGYHCCYHCFIISECLPERLISNSYIYCRTYHVNLAKTLASPQVANYAVQLELSSMPDSLLKSKKNVGYEGIKTSATIANHGHAYSVGPTPYSGYDFYKSILLHILAKGKYTPKGIVSA
jgi:hypothetical protein